MKKISYGSQNIAIGMKLLINLVGFSSSSIAKIHRRLFIYLGDQGAQKYAPPAREVTEHLRTLSVRAIYTVWSFEDTIGRVPVGKVQDA